MIEYNDRQPGPPPPSLQPERSPAPIGPGGHPHIYGRKFLLYSPALWLVHMANLKKITALEIEIMLHKLAIACCPGSRDTNTSLFKQKID